MKHFRWDRKTKNSSRWTSVVWHELNYRFFSFIIFFLQLCLVSVNLTSSSFFWNEDNLLWERLNVAFYWALFLFLFYSNHTLLCVIMPNQLIIIIMIIMNTRAKAKKKRQRIAYETGGGKSMQNKRKSIKRLTIYVNSLFEYTTLTEKNDTRDACEYFFSLKYVQRLIHFISVFDYGTTIYLWPLGFGQMK